MAARKRPPTVEETQAALRTAPKLLRLALGSESQNERHSAFDRFHALMHKHGLTFDDLIPSEDTGGIDFEAATAAATAVRAAAADPNVQKIAVNIGDLIKSGIAVADKFRQARKGSK